MNSLQDHCSLTPLVLKTIYYRSKGTTICIKPDDGYFVKSAKNMGIYMERHFWTAAFAVAFIAIPIFASIDVGLHLKRKLEFNPIKSALVFSNGLLNAFQQQLHNIFRTVLT